MRVICGWENRSRPYYRGLSDVGWVEVRLRYAQAALTRSVRAAQNPTYQSLVLGFAALNPTIAIDAIVWT